MAAGNYHVDLENDPELKAIEDEKGTKLEADAKEWDGRITESDGYFEDLITNSKEYAEDQKALLKEQNDFAIDQINQQKDQAEKNYVKEQSGAYVDWQKQINEYGVNAERRASMGMTGTGYSESSKVSMYNAYQNRVAVARQSFDNAVLNYNNAIREAQLQSDSKLAEIAYNALQTEIEFTIQKLQYRNDLIFKKAESQRAIENEYFNKWKAVLDQINTENAIAEQARQFDEEMQFAREQAELNSGVIDKGTGNNDTSNNYIPDSSKIVGKISGQTYANSQAAYVSISNQAANFKSNKSLGLWLDRQVEEGFITEQQADALYEKNFKLQYSSWKAGEDGGWYIGEINDNATVINEDGKEYRLDDLIDALIDEGMKKKAAKSFVKSLQEKLW